MIKLNNSVSRKIFGAAMAVTLAATGCGERKEAQSPQAQGARAVPVKLQKIETTTTQNSSDFVGTLEAQQRVALAPQIEGRIEQILATNGQVVKRGTPIIQIEPTRQQEEVNSRQSQVSARIADYNAALANVNSAQADEARSEAEVERAKADLQQTQAELDLAKVTFDRTKFLVGQGVQPQQALDDGTRDVSTKTAARDAQQQTLNASLKSLKAAQERIKQNQASAQGQKALVAQAQADLAVGQQSLNYNLVRAPIDGIVGRIDVKVGDFVTIGQALTNITQNEELYINIGIPVERSSDLKIGTPVHIIKADGKPGVKGKVSFISPQVDSNTQAILAKVSFQNNYSLRDSQFVRVRVIWEEKPGVLIPTSAVTRIGGQNFVFVATPSEAKDGQATDTAKQQPVVLGNIQGQSYQVISGINAGDRVVVSGILNLTDGVPIVEEQAKSQK